MDGRKYSAGMVSKGFWFQEFRKYNEYIEKGYTDREIKEIQEEKNIFTAPSRDYGVKMINEVSKRVNILPEELRNIILGLSISDQKMINLLGVMMTDRLFFEYMYEVIREKLIIGDIIFTNKDTRVFLRDKSEQEEGVAKYTAATRKRLVGAYRTYLIQSGFIEIEKGQEIIRKPILDFQIKRIMKEENLDPYLKIFLGE